MSTIFLNPPSYFSNHRPNHIDIYTLLVVATSNVFLFNTTKPPTQTFGSTMRIARARIFRMLLQDPKLNSCSTHTMNTHLSNLTKQIEFSFFMEICPFCNSYHQGLFLHPSVLFYKSWLTLWDQVQQRIIETTVFSKINCVFWYMRDSNSKFLPPQSMRLASSHFPFWGVSILHDRELDQSFSPSIYH